jgi:hypothetical protein
MSNQVGTICRHDRIRRVDENFMECVECNFSYIQQIKTIQNKKASDFIEENGHFDRHFSRNFNNKFDSSSDWNDKYMRPVHEQNKMANQNTPSVFRSENGSIEVVVDRTVGLNTNPVQYGIRINGELSFATENEIKQLLYKIKAMKIQ